MKNKKNLKIALLLIVFVLLITGAIYLYSQSRQETQEGSKTINVEIVMSDEKTTSYEIKTDEEFLRGALEEKDLISGEETDMGLFVKTVDGYTVDDSKQEWWLIFKNDESLMTGTDETVVYDGDSFRIELQVGY
ncbi:MAG TPA: DUF4430 domain-containing protein [Clostridiales bacterium]|nr:DUF4430 domain-containing protein [Clostridiales bacterium]